MGRLMACKLSRIGLEPVLLTRDGGAGTARIPLREGASQEVFTIASRGIDWLPQRSVAGVLVTTKANDAEAAVASAAPALQAGAPVILLHNGMGVLEQVAASCPDITLYAGTTTEGAYLEDAVVVHAGLGSTVIGRQGQDAPDWYGHFTSSAERFEWNADIDAVLWRKLLINCAINPLTALHRCRNGNLLDNPVLRAEVELLCEELAAVSAARGNDRGATCALDWALSVIQATAGNQSSMLQDVAKGRPTEIEHITGYLVREARRLGVPCPRNERLLDQVRALDSDRSSN
jgi:2-dehydropantoate 2-reductase